MFLLFPLPLYAAVSISEIMYDAPGTDTKHEWIEVANTGSAVDLSTWKLFEGGTNHKLTIYAGSSSLGAGGYAILADDPATFMGDYPSYSGVLFDTTFTSGLSNSGETLVLRDESLADQDTVTYDTSLGAAGDGNTLQKVGSSWQALAASPGAAPSASSPAPTQTDTDTSNSQSTTGTQTQTSSSAQNQGGGFPVTPQIHALAGEDRTVIAGAAVVFAGNAVGLAGQALDNARYVWSFGNGDVREGQSVLYTFQFPGTYVVTLDASSGAFTASDRVMVTAVPASLVISRVTSDFIEIQNAGSAEVDLGLWQLSAGGKTFTFPAHTVILADSSVDVSNAATGLTPSGPSDLSLLYPNGSYAAGYQPTLLTPAPAPHAASAIQAAPSSAAPATAVTASHIDAKDQTANAGFLPQGASGYSWLIVLVSLAVIGGGAIFARPRLKGLLESFKNTTPSN
jgi:hypothetical protein